MTKSEVVLTLAQAKELILPSSGAEFKLTYFAHGEEIVYGTKDHTNASAVSPGLKVTVLGEDTWMAQRRQAKPFVQAGNYRNMLVIRHGSSWIHILGDHIIVSDRDFTVGMIAPGAKE